MCWKVSEIGDVCALYQGVAINAKTKKCLVEKSELPLLRIKDLKNNTVEQFIDPENFPANALVNESDIIYTRTGSLGLVFTGRKGVLHNNSFKVVPCPEISKEYLFHWLQNPSFKEIIIGLASKAAQPDITHAIFKKQKIVFPSLLEQKRIVTILDQAFADIEQARAKTEQNLKNARELFESYLQRVFSQRGDGWVEKTLGEAVVVERGSSPRPIKKFQTNSEEGVNWIKIGDAKEGQKYINSTKEKITREGATKSRFVDVGDFILSNSMSFGRPYIMSIQGYIHDGWFVLRLPENIDSNYFYCLLSSPYVKDQLYRLAAGAIVKNISGDLVKKAILPFPSIEKQRDIAKKLTVLAAEIESLKAIYVKKSEDLDELKKSILQKAFNGELTNNLSKGAAA